MLNSRGHAPTLLLVVIALMLSISVYFSFLTFEDTLIGKGIPIARASGDLSFQSAYVQDLSYWLVSSSYHFYPENQVTIENMIYRIKEQASLFGEHPILRSDFLGKLRNGEFMLNESSGNYHLHVSNVSTYAESGSTKMSRTFDVDVGFRPSRN